MKLSGADLGWSFPYNVIIVWDSPYNLRWLVVVAVINSIISIYYYFYPIVVMFFIGSSRRP